jgi:uncharacterized protein YxeA
MKKILIGIIIGVVVIGITYGFSINKSQNTVFINELTKEPIVDTTQKSGPFQINKSQYKLGERIFFVVDELQNKDKGQAIFFRPLNSTHSTPYKEIQFDGKMKNSFNQMIKPELEEKLGTCKKEDLIGNWTIWFRGTNYSNIEFQITKEIIKGETKFDKQIC